VVHRFCGEVDEGVAVADEGVEGVADDPAGEAGSHLGGFGSKGVGDERDRLSGRHMVPQADQDVGDTSMAGPDPRRRHRHLGGFGVGEVVPAPHPKGVQGAEDAGDTHIDGRGVEAN
jgi:hypothetical protein